jgi:hypothetical protein
MPFNAPISRARIGLLAAVALGALTFALHAAPSARANARQISIMMDDNLVVYSPNNLRLAALKSMKAIGVDLIRATVLWNIVAHGTKDPRTHHRFDPTNPADYPKANWVLYDQLVQDAQAVGIGVYFNVTGPGPPWAMGKTSDRVLKKAFMPDAAQFGKFVQALGRRYSGTYPNGALANGQPKPGDLPRMSLWSIWNEPNWPTWLAPQNVYSQKLHKLLPYSPILYRNLFYSARAALDRTGHKTDFVMLGETQPLGSDPQNGRTPMRPGLFIRELFCVDSHLHPFTGLEASARGCDVFRRRGPMAFTAWAHHPYTKKAPPTWTDSNRDSFTLGDIAHLPQLLDAIATRTHRLPDKLPILVTEMGYSTDPPNPYRGVSLATQAAWINESDYLAYRQPRVYSMTQFEYRDSPPVTTAKKGSMAYWGTFQTGITFLDGSLKPSYQAYEMPLWLHSGHDSQGQGQIELWAQVRFRKGANQSDRVVFQFQPTGSTQWTSVTSALPLSPYGFVTAIVPEASYSAGGTFRAVWGGPVAPVFFISRTVSFP